MSETWRLAIDFGTSNTAAAHQTAGGEAVTIPLTHQGNLMPSSVFVGPEGVTVGLAAQNRAGSRPAAYVPSPKRYVDTESVNVDGSAVPVAGLMAAVLDHVLGVAARHHDGSAPEQVVLTHPEAWSPAAVARLVEAARLANIPRDRLALVSEPRAAAHFYSHHHPVPPGARVAVFDYGGGTLDVAVLEAEQRGFRVVSARGDNSLGGRNVDAAIRRWVDAQLEDDQPAVKEYLDTRASAGVVQALEHSIRGAKEILSDTSSATITVSTPDGETNLLLTREEFERIIEQDVARAVDITVAALRDSGANPSDATMLYLTGGSARIPHVQDRLGRITRVATLDDPKTVVARGALYAETVDADGTGRAPGGADPFAGLAGGAAAGAAGAGGAAAAAAGRPETPGPGRAEAATAPGGHGGPGGYAPGRSGSGAAALTPPGVGADTGDGTAPRRRFSPRTLGALGLVVVLVLALAVWGGMQMLGGDPAPEAEQKIPVKGLSGAPAQTLPNAYLGQLRSCSSPSTNSMIWTDAQVKSSSCSWRENSTYGTDFDTSSTYVSDDQRLSQAIRDTAGPALIDGTYAVEVLQQAGKGKPLVTVAHMESSTSSWYLAATYDDNTSLTANSIDSKEKAEGLAKAIGLLG